MASGILTTTVVGSYPQPDWLVDRERSGGHGCRRASAHREIWRVSAPFLEEAQDDATLLAIRDMERAGIDIITDGEMRRESYSNRFATALDGVDIEQPGTRSEPRRPARTAGAARRRPDPPARAGRGARRRAFLRANTDRADQDHPARPVHHGAAGAGRLLQGRGGAGHGLCRRGERRGARSQGGRRRRRSSSTSRGSRRAPRRPAAMASRPSTARSAGDRRHHRDASLLRLCQVGARQAERPTRSWRNSPTAPRPDLDRGGAAASSISACCATSRPRPSCSASSISRRPRSRRPRPSPRTSARALACITPERLDPGARLRHEIPAARRGLRQVEGAGRRRGPGAAQPVLKARPNHPPIEAGDGSYAGRDVRCF